MASVIDSIQARYGWSDRDILSIPYARFMQIVGEVQQAKEDKWRELAFLGWQMTAPFRETSVSFKEYHDSLFSKNEDGEIKPIDKEQAVERANQILDMFTK